MTLSSNRKEERQAKKDGLSLVKNSGRGMNKGDATLNDKYMVDYKITDAKSWSVNLEKFHALEKQAWRQNKEAVMVIAFDSHKSKTIAIIDFDTLKEILNEQEQ